MENLKPETWFQLDFALKHDEECLLFQKNKWKARLLFVLLSSAAIAFSVIGLTLFCGVVGALAATVLVVIFLQNRYRPKQYLPFVYTKGHPSPAILSQTDPLTLYALADLGVGEVEPIYGLRRFQVKDLPGHSVVIGERVPCAAMYESSKTHPQQFLYYRIHPYCWATSRPEYIRAWTSAIPEMEWNLLEASMAAYPDLEDGEILELRVDGTPIGRRYYREDINR